MDWLTVGLRPLERTLDRAGPVRVPWAGLAIGTNIAIRVVIVISTLSLLWAGPFYDADVHRFSELSVASGIPYRDHAVEYAPVELAVIRAIGSSDTRATATRLVIVCFLLDLLSFAGMWSGWGRRTAITYLWLGVPLLVLRYVRLWYLPVALSVWGFALLRKRRPNLAGVAAALAVFAKLWPIALVPAFIAEARRRSFAFVLAGVVGGIGWLLLGGIGGIRQVLTFRSATGWEVESTIGSVVWLFGGGEPRWEAGAVRVGSSEGLTWLPAVVLVVLLGAVWWKALRSEREDLVGVPSLVAVCALLACSPVFSLQYVGWLTPWAAIASRDPRRVPIASAWAIVVLTAGVTVALWKYADSLGDLGAVMLLARNGLCLFLPIWYLTRGRPAVAMPGASYGNSAEAQPARADRPAGKSAFGARG
jgi:Glycosyltransferase family 87